MSDIAKAQVNPTDLQLTLQVAYQVFEAVEKHTVEALFRAQDRLDWNRHTINEDSQRQRWDATMRIALELDRRNVPLRDPTLPNPFTLRWGEPG